MIRLPAQDIVAEFADVAMATTSEQERRHANAGFRGLVFLVQRQRGITRFMYRRITSSEW
jgi:hypothetical protein